ncbi:MAG: hypothetical protein SFU83_21970 [Meiothermus sp.]|nr:hypothetical protein [Meiothermus sp.]
MNPTDTQRSGQPRGLFYLTRFAGLVFLVLSLSQAFAQNLLSLAPTGAVAGLSVADLRNSRYTRGIVADWQQSGMQRFLQQQLRAQAAEESDLIGIAAGGLAAALYSDGFFVVARPDARAMQALRRQAPRNLKPQNGWQVGTEQEAMFGFSRDLVFVAAPKYGRLFLQNRRGLQAPIQGEIVLWGAVPLELVRQFNLPPRTQGAAQTLRRFSYALRLNSSGYTDEMRLEVNPSADPALAAILLPRNLRPYDAATLPSGLSVSTGVLELNRLGRYLTTLLREFDIRQNFDLSAFGSRYATVTVQGPPPAPDGRGENLLGHSLIYWEVSNPGAAEGQLRDLLSQIADFSTPQGQGGLKDLPGEGDFKAVEVGFGGAIYYKLEPGRIVIATSKAALGAVNNKPWSENPAFQRYRDRVPAGALGLTFGDQGDVLRDSARQIGDSLPQTIGGELDTKTQQELTKALGDFMTRLGNRFGPSLSYGVVEGNTLISRGIYEVKW